MKLCKVAADGKILSKAVLDFTGDTSISPARRMWAKFLTVDCDGGVFLWENEPFVYVPKPEDPIMSQIALASRWVTKAPAYCDLLFHSRMPVDDFATQIYKLQYEENKNEIAEKTSGVDVTGLDAGGVLV